MPVIYQQNNNEQRNSQQFSVIGSLMGLGVAGLIQGLITAILAVKSKQ